MAKAWGIDIGRSAIKGIQLRHGSRGLEIAAADQELLKVRPGATDAEKDEAQRQALTAFLSRNRIRGERVIVSIPGHTAFNRLLRIPPVERKKLASSIRFEAQQQIPFPIDEVIWDYQELPRDAAAGEDWEINLFAVKKEFIQKTLINLELVGLEVDGLQVSPLALFNFMRYDHDLRGANVLIDMGGESTDLILLDSDKTWIRNIPIAGQDITKQLEEKFKIPFAEAEKLKLKSTGTKQAQKIFKVMKPSLAEMSAEISRSMGYYTSQVPDINFREAYLTGNSSQLVGLKRFVGETLELKARNVDVLKRITLPTGDDLDLLNENFPAFPVALGLAVQAMGEGACNVNLLPRALIESRAEKRKRPWFVAAAAILAITLLVLFFSKSAFRDDYVSAMDKAEKVMGQHKDLSGQLAGFRKTGDIKSKIKSRSALSSDRVAVLGVYDDIQRLLLAPEGDAGKKAPRLWLIKVDIQPKAAEGDGAVSALTVSMLAAMPKPLPEKELSDDEVKGLAREAVKKFVIKRVAGFDSRYANVKQDLERLVADLDMNITPGKKYYRFRVTWDVNLEGK